MATSTIDCSATAVAERAIELAELKTAYKNVLLGEKVKRVEHGDSTEVEFNPMTQGHIRRLKQRIDELEAEVCHCAGDTVTASSSRQPFGIRY